MSTVSSLIYGRAQREAFIDDNLAAFAIAEYRAGRMGRQEAERALRAAGRFEAEITEALA